MKTNMNKHSYEIIVLYEYEDNRGTVTQTRHKHKLSLHRKTVNVVIEKISLFNKNRDFDGRSNF